MTIDAKLKGIGPGAYALGSINSSGGLAISYVGRSDDDVTARIKDHVGKYSAFKYAFYPDRKSAFLKECELFHNFGAYSLDNKVHPARPQNSGWTCPYCKVLT
jgi:hypothetical protein